MSATGPLNDQAATAEIFVAAALKAGAAILQFWRKGGRAQAKSDGSPVTEADLAANSIILATLAEAFPATPVVSEEAAPPDAAACAEKFILVDPLDGTKEFLKGTEEFTVNIALIDRGHPVCGVVYAPAMGRIWQGFAATVRAGDVAPGETDARKIRWRDIGCRRPSAAPVAVVSRSHLDGETQGWLATHGVRETAPSGSSIKFCLIAEGRADVYPRFGRTMEWDTAAGDAILRAAGGGMETVDGEAFRYGKANKAYANSGFIARGRKG